MKVTKFVHSCLLVETPNIKVLIDPGRFTWDSHLLDIGKLPKLDYIVVTHEHPDHYCLPALQALSERFSHTPIVTNNDLAKKIREQGLKNPVGAGSEDGLTVFEAKHEQLPMNLPNVLNIGVHIDDALTHSGDSYQLQSTRDILALPITAPFASYKEALKAIVKLNPKIVLPMHDWEWHKEARQSRYKWANQLLESKGIKLIELENAATVEI